MARRRRSSLALSAILLPPSPTRSDTAARLTAGPMAGFDAAGADHEFVADTPPRSLLVINSGTPRPGAWFPRLPCLDDAKALTIL